MDRPATLNATFVRQIKRPGRYGDGRGGYGLSVLVKTTTNGRMSKTWSQRYYVNGKPVMIGLGAFPIVSLAEARAKALENRRAVEQGRDPRGHGAVTFEQAAEKVIALHAPNWRDQRREHTWRSSLERFAYPRLATRPVADITAADILAVVAPIWADRRETARKLLGRIRAVLRWAMAEGLRDDDPTAAVTAALPKNGNVVEHHRALPANQVRGAVATVRASGAHWATKAAFELIALCGVRSGEARLATWAEVDFDAAVWTIDGSRTKTSAAQRIPLSRRAVEVLRDAHDHTGGDGYVFPGPTGRPLSDAAASSLLRGLGIDGTVHGLRSTLRSWCAEEGVPRDLSELLLGHVVAGVEGAYQRSDLLERRREVLERWAEYVAVNP